VDFAARRAALDVEATPQELLKRWRDGHIKQWLIAQLLALRAANPALFSEGEYLPLTVEGEAASHVLAFARHLDGSWLIVVLPRLTVPILGARALPQVPPDRWGATHIVLPPKAAAVELRGLCGHRFNSTDMPATLPAQAEALSNAPGTGLLMLTDVLASVPVNVLHSLQAMHSIKESVS
jgi:maltooligosyltrehalose synthase